MPSGLNGRSRASVRRREPPSASSSTPCSGRFARSGPMAPSGTRRSATPSPAADVVGSRGRTAPRPRRSSMACVSTTSPSGRTVASGSRRARGMATTSSPTRSAPSRRTSSPWTPRGRANRHVATPRAASAAGAMAATTRRRTPGDCQGTRRSGPPARSHRRVGPARGVTWVRPDVSGLPIAECGAVMLDKALASASPPCTSAALVAG